MTAPVVDPAVVDARSRRRGIVALESTVFSDLGLPPPWGQEALDRCWRAIEDAGASPAITAVVDGEARVGLAWAERSRVCGPAMKVASRDLGVAVAHGSRLGATTVSAALALAAASGIEVFATGGIGGVHAGAAETFDVSADLHAIARHPIVTVCAGPKAFLDLAATVEVLESLEVPVLGWGTDELPAFTSRRSGVLVPVRVDSAAQVAAIARQHWSLGGAGVVVAAPIPAEAEIPRAELDGWITAALDRVTSEGVRGPGVTPALLDEVARRSDQRSVRANVVLAEHNAAVAAEIAVALA